MPDLAASLCQQQFELFMDARPLTGLTAKYALEPLVNLSRLLMRAGEPEAACHQLEELYRAVRTRESAIIDGQEIPVSELTGPGQEHRDLCQWLWGVMLADGVRALASTSSWSQAAAFARQHRGIGRRLLHGRQAAIIAQALTGHPEAALAMIEQSSVSEAWEHATAGCLTMFCRHAAGHPPKTADTTPVYEYLALETTPELAAYRIRIALTAASLAAAEASDRGDSILCRVVSEASGVEDGYVARDLLRNPDLKERLTAAQRANLVSTLHRAGLGRGNMPEPLQAELCTAAAWSRRAAAELLSGFPAAQLS
jgi:hypothetical protein